MEEQLLFELGGKTKPKKTGKVIKFTPRLRRILDTAEDIAINPVERIAYQHQQFWVTV